jgi:hypothetical protein
VPVRAAGAIGGQNPEAMVPEGQSDAGDRLPFEAGPSAQRRSLANDDGAHLIGTADYHGGTLDMFPGQATQCGCPGQLESQIPGAGAGPEPEL